MKAISTLILALCVLTASAQVSPAPKQTESILIVGATAHLGTGKVMQNSAIGFKDGKLTFVGHSADVNRSEWEKVIDASGKHVYPGFICPSLPVGLFEIGAVRATQDNREVGFWNPHVRAIIAYNTDSKITPTIRSNGVLMAQVTPRGGRISGTSSVVELDGWNWDDAVYRMDDGVHMNWPGYFQWSWTGTGPKNKDYDSQVQDIKDRLNKAVAYGKASNHPEVDLRLEAVQGLFDGSKTLYIHADNVKEITHIASLKREFNLPKVVLVGGADSWMVTDLLRENNIGVMLQRVHSLPSREEDDVYMPYKLPSILQKAGVKWCLTYEGDMEVMGSRNLPFTAGTACAYGMDKEEALMGITSNTADLLGIGDRVGTLEVGKDATLFISDGDALDMRTNNVTEAFISGKQIDLDNHHKQLYRKYKAKYDNQ